LIFDLKTVSYVGYFILLAFAAVMIFFLVLMEGGDKIYFASDDCVCSIGSWCIGLDTNPYMEIVQPESKELILSLPIDGFKYGFLRMLRLFAIYTGLYCCYCILYIL